MRATYRNLLRSERGQDRPLDLSIGGLKDARSRPIDLKRRTVIWAGRSHKATDLRRAWHHVQLNRRSAPLPLYSPPEKLEPCHSLQQKFILQNESAPEPEPALSNTARVSSAIPVANKGQNSLFGGSTHCPKSDKVASSNATFAPAVGNPFKKITDASTEPASKSILAPSKFSGFSNTNTGSNFVFGSTVMKPSSFSSLNAKPATDAFKLKPSLLSNSLSNNPFKKTKVDDSDEDSSSSNKNEDQQKEKVLEPEGSSKEDAESIDQPSLFVPLSSQSESKKDETLKTNGVTSTNTQSGFIFGQNMLPKNSDQPSTGSIFDVPATKHGDNKSENLFCKAVSVLPTDQIPQGDWPTGKTLVETSRELTEREQNLKRKYDEVQVVTGEEEESNVIQMVCKLYSWISGSWQERGRGILRLNDRAINSELFSRLVVRTQGTLTIMLNTKVWPEMSLEKVNEKSVRFTACDADGQPKIFLVMGAPKDIEILYTSLDYRIFETKQQKKTQKSEDEETKV